MLAEFLKARSIEDKSKIFAKFFYSAKTHKEKALYLNAIYKFIQVLHNVRFLRVNNEIQDDNQQMFLRNADFQSVRLRLPFADNVVTLKDLYDMSPTDLQNVLRVAPHAL